jgi:hemerythrin-like domain-containing protein
VPIIIGKEPGSDFRDPLGLLRDCHRRIENFLNVLHTVTQQGSGMHLLEEQRQALEVSLRYFQESAPKHAADEEESLFPRMLTRSGSNFATISDVLNKLNAEHSMLRLKHDDVEEIGRSWLALDFLGAEELSRLTTILQDLKETYTRHIAIEEKEVFLLAARILDSADLQSIAKEMAERRGLQIKDHTLLHRAGR